MKENLRGRVIYDDGFKVELIRVKRSGRLEIGSEVNIPVEKVEGLSKVYDDLGGRSVKVSGSQKSK